MLEICSLIFFPYKSRTKAIKKVPGNIPCLCSGCSFCWQTTLCLDQDTAQQHLSQAIMSLRVRVHSGHPKPTQEETSIVPVFWYRRHSLLPWTLVGKSCYSSQPEAWWRSWSWGSVTGTVTQAVPPWVHGHLNSGLEYDIFRSALAERSSFEFFQKQNPNA